MRMNFQVPTPLAYFQTLVGSDESFPLLEAAASLVQDEHPETDIAQVLADVDQLLARLKRRVARDAPALQRLRALNQFLPRPGLWRQLQQLLRPRQQLSEHGDAHPQASRFPWP